MITRAKEESWQNELSELTRARGSDMCETVMGGSCWHVSDLKGFPDMEAFQSCNSKWSGNIHLQTSNHI